VEAAQTELSLKIYYKNMIVVAQYNIIFPRFSPCTSVKLIKLITYFIVILLMNERKIYIKFFEIQCLSQNYHVFRVNSKKKFSP